MTRWQHEENAAVAQRAERAEEQEDGDHQAEVADDVDDKGFAGGGDGRRARVPEADQQKRGQADAGPADQQEQEVVGRHQQRHRKDEEVQEGEEAPVAGVVRHVANGVDMDEEADAR